MAETLITPDGKLHILLGSTNLVSIIREYAGDGAVERLRAVHSQWLEELETALELTAGQDMRPVLKQLRDSINNTL